MSAVTLDTILAAITRQGIELRSEISELGNRLTGDISELRTELKGDIAELRTELGSVARKVDAIYEHTGHLTERVSHLERSPREPSA